jgi:hypothetical protein
MDQLVPLRFGALTYLETGGKMGTMEYLVSQALAGIVFSLLAGRVVTPLLGVRWLHGAYWVSSIEPCFDAQQ